MLSRFHRISERNGLTDIRDDFVVKTDRENIGNRFFQSVIILKGV